MEPGQAPKAASAVAGRYTKDGVTELYCDPRIAHYVVALETPKLPTEQEDLVTCVEFNKQVLRRGPLQNHMKEVHNYIIQLIQQGDKLTDAGECTGKPCKNFVGVYNHKGQKTIYISRDLGTHAMKTLNILPILEGQEKEKYFSLKDLAEKLYHRSSYNTQKTGISNVKELELFLTGLHNTPPLESVCKDSETGKEMTAAQAIKMARAPSGQKTIYTRKEMLPYMEYNFLAPFPTEEREHWIAGSDICRELHIAPYPARLTAAGKRIEEIRGNQRDNTILLGDSKKKIGNIIRRFSKNGNNPTYYIRREAVVRTDDEERLGYKGLINEKDIDDKVKKLAPEKTHASLQLPVGDSFVASVPSL